MSFLDNAISAHSSWKVKLVAAVNGGTVPNKASCCVDNTCELGKWIYSEGQTKYGNLPAFSNLRTAHKKFHQSVGAVIDLVQNKHIPEAKKSINEGEFHMNSNEVTKTIMEMKKLV